mmetsp:Transcript_14877/g.40758  ORF Transcript_14877/g.40758 Transcript_14877/m.40758 type:complete len:361 (-) Transcript_14877:552-1634(-)
MLRRVAGLASGVLQAHLQLYGGTVEAIERLLPRVQPAGLVWWLLRVCKVPLVRLRLRQSSTLHQSVNQRQPGHLQGRRRRPVRLEDLCGRVAGDRLQGWRAVLRGAHCRVHRPRIVEERPIWLVGRGQRLLHREAVLRLRRSEGRKHSRRHGHDEGQPGLLGRLREGSADGWRNLRHTCGTRPSLGELDQRPAGRVSPHAAPGTSFLPGGGSALSGHPLALGHHSGASVARRPRELACRGCPGMAVAPEGGGAAVFRLRRSRRCAIPARAEARSHRRALLLVWGNPPRLRLPHCQLQLLHWCPRLPPRAPVHESRARVPGPPRRPSGHLPSGGRARMRRQRLDFPPLPDLSRPTCSYRAP